MPEALAAAPLKLPFLTFTSEHFYAIIEVKKVKSMVDCHIHMVLSGADWRAAIARHSACPDESEIRTALSHYREAGFTYLRDCGDKWGVGRLSREIAPEYGIRYRTPYAPLSKRGHYGGFIGLQFETLKEYAALVHKQRSEGADFTKIMISGLMDFDRFGTLSEEGLTPSEIAEMVHIAHEEGTAVSAHANGSRAVLAAAKAGVDSIEHGAYLDEEALFAMQEAGTVWVPTLSTIGNLFGTGRFDETEVRKIYESALGNVRRFSEIGGLLAPGSDAGAFAVPHGQIREYEHLKNALGEDWERILAPGIDRLTGRF